MFALNETNVYRVCCTPVDMRQGILRLCQFVRGNDFNPSDGCVYVIDTTVRRVEVITTYELT